MSKEYRFLLPQVVAKLKRIDLKARLVVEGFLAGLHKSPYKGFSVEFTEYRPYIPGDELKRIDWKLFGKTDKLYIREYEEETNLKAYLLLDASGSMGYTSSSITKLEYSSYLAASLAYLLMKQRDSVGLVVFSSQLDTYIPARSAPHHLSILLKTLDQLRPKGETDLSKTFHNLAERIKRRGLIIILSDLFDNKERMVSALRHFRHKKHEVLVFHILDKRELDFDFRAPLILKDLENSQEVLLDPRIIRKDYQTNLETFFRDFKRQLRESLIDYHRIMTNLPFDRALLSYLEKRKRLG